MGGQVEGGYLLGSERRQASAAQGGSRYCCPLLAMTLTGSNAWALWEAGVRGRRQDEG